MKKALAIILALCMILSFAALAACDSGSTNTDTQNETNTNTDTDTNTQTNDNTQPDNNQPSTPEPDETIDLANSLPKEYLREKAEAGMEPTIALCAPALNTDLMIMMDEGFANRFGELGFNYVSSSFNADSAQLIQQLENYDTMKVSMIITLIFDDGVKDMVDQVMADGIYVCVWSFIPSFPVSLAMVVDEYTFGQLAGHMASFWVDEQYPDAGDGEVKAALLTQEMNQTYIIRFDGVRDALAENSKIDVVYTDSNPDMSTPTGYDFAEAALTYDSSIRLFVGFTASQAVGMSQYITAQIPSDKWIEFAAFGTDNSQVGRDMIDQSVGGESIVRGLAGQGTDNPADYMVDYMLDLIDGKVEEGSVVYAPIYTYDTVGFNYDERG